MTVPRRARVEKSSKFSKPPGCANCSMEKKGKGFCPDLIRIEEVKTADPLSGGPISFSPVTRPKLAVWAQSPGTSEIMKVPPEPLCGPSGFVLDNWVIPRSGITLPYSKCNVLRCHPPGDQYPTGKIRRAAEQQCRQYDRLTPEDFDIVLVTLHPSGVMHNKFDPLPLIINDFQRAEWLLTKNLNVMVLMGGEAMELWAPNLKHPVKGETFGVTDWRGHYFPTRKYMEAVAQIDDEAVKYEWRSLIHPHVHFWTPTHPDELGSFMSKETLALDLEWNPENPRQLTRVGLAFGEAEVASFEWDMRYQQPLSDVLRTAGEVVMHNGLGHKSDIDVLAANGITVDKEKVRDSMLAFHLIWPQFAGLGHLDLWTFASLYTKEPNWKICRGEGHCFGPCPVHDPAGYNAKDVRETWRSWMAIRPELLLRGLL